jgi:hypothetical protein
VFAGYDQNNPKPDTLWANECKYTALMSLQDSFTLMHKIIKLLTVGKCFKTDKEKSL